MFSAVHISRNLPSRLQTKSQSSHTLYTHLHELNITGLSFPMSVRDVPKFENLNPNISVSVSVFKERQLIPLYLSPHRNRQHTVHLLLLSDGNTQHYTLIRNLSRLVSGRTKRQNQTYVCPYCFHCFRYEHCLDLSLIHI